MAAAQAEKKAAPAKKTEAAPKKAEGGKTVEITADDTMKYNVTAITAKPGEAIHIKLTNKGTMPKMAAAHNFVLLKKGTDLNAFTTAAVMAGQTDYIPAKLKEQVLASTKLAGPGETVETDFKAPTVPGTYDFICSFPGHFATMKGTLTVAK
jgi:azurin